jgi:menaquinone-dependent protoporphyrinogen IX oxidase
MSRILVTYSTNSGSTAEVAKVIAEELTQTEHSVETKSLKNVQDLTGYDAVVVGAPMIFGWHMEARRFLRKHRSEMSGKKLALFACAMRLTTVPDAVLPDVPLSLDPNLAVDPQQPGKLNFKERFTSVGNYLKPIFQACPDVIPVSVAFFKGSLDMRRLKWWQAAFVMLVVQATPGDYRDWEYIRKWARATGITK